jgi:hypothetical protein
VEKTRPVANHRRQNIKKAHSIPYLKSSKTRLGEIQTYLHYIQPSIGVGFKILVGAPLFFPLDGQTKGGVVVGTTGTPLGSTRTSSPFTLGASHPPNFGPLFA